MVPSLRPFYALRQPVKMTGYRRAFLFRRNMAVILLPQRSGLNCYYYANEKESRPESWTQNWLKGLFAMAQPNEGTLLPILANISRG